MTESTPSLAISPEQDAPAHYDYLQLIDGDETISITFRPPLSPARAIGNRIGRAARLFARNMYRRGAVRMTDIDDEWQTFGFEVYRLEEAQILCQELDMKLRRMFAEPLPAKHVDAVLAISGKERRRWTKDGRLPSCGYHLSSRTKDNFSVKTYDVDTIETLLNEPETIDRWRQEDDATDRQLQNCKFA